MSKEAFFGNWMVAVAEAAEVAGSGDLDTATVVELERAWELVTSAADLSRDDLATEIARQAGLEVADLDSAEPHAVHIVPAEVAWRRLVLPLRCDERELVVATANPLSQDAKREIAALAARSVVFAIAPPSDIHAAIEAAYGVAPAAGSPRPSRPDEVKPGGPHVLVVDDEAGARALFRSVLEEGGFRVTVVNDGPEAIAKLESGEPFDLVSLDYWMDKMNGLRVLQHVRHDPRTADLPVIMVTGADDRRIEMSLFEAGADDFIIKPIDAPLFLLRIHAVLRRRQHR